MCKCVLYYGVFHFENKIIKSAEIIDWDNIERRTYGKKCLNLNCKSLKLNWEVMFCELFIL